MMGHVVTTASVVLEFRMGYSEDTLQFRSITATSALCTLVQSHNDSIFKQLSVHLFHA